MKPYQRRSSGNYPYFKLASWDARSFTWRDGKVAYPSLEDAIAAAKAPGRYRVSKVDVHRRLDLEPFEVPSGTGCPCPQVSPLHSRTAPLG